MVIVSPPSKGCGTPSKWHFKWLINGGLYTKPRLHPLGAHPPSTPIQEISNRTHWTDPEQTCVSNRFFRNLPPGPLGPWVLAPQFLMDPRIPHWVSLSKIDVLIRSLHTLCACALAFGTVGWPKAVLETGETSWQWHISYMNILYKYM